MPKLEVIKNQVFVGCPWKIVRLKYEKVIAAQNKKYPLSFIIVGRESSQEAEDLLNVIKIKLQSSSYAIFDATGGNPNVSLEFGLAEADDIPRALYISSHRAAAKNTDQSPVISDLAGKKRNMYKTEKSLAQLISNFSRSHAYTVLFEKVMGSEFRGKSKGTKKRYRTLCLKIIHTLDGVDRVRRVDLIQNLRTLIHNYSEQEIEHAIKLLHLNKLILSETGRYSSIRMV